MMRRVILCGGGHSHVLALPYLMQKSPPNIEWMLVSDSPFAPYSGMLPGFISGQFSRAQCLIDLPKLCAAHRIIWRQDSLTKIEEGTDSGAIRLSSGDTIPFDILSVNIGGKQTPLFSPNSAQVVTVKPAQPLMDFVDNLPPAKDSESKNISIAIIGSGAGGCEIAMALRRRLPLTDIQLIGKSLLPDFNPSVRNKIRHILQSRNIRFQEGNAVSNKQDGISFCVQKEDNINSDTCTATHIIFATPVTASAPIIHNATKNKEINNGGIAVNAYLQSVDLCNNAPIFASGDCAESGAAKSGVVAVRQAPILAHNIIAYLNKTPLQKWQAKKSFLYILNTADEKAIANWGRFSFSGKTIWTWKKYLDLSFMRRVTDIYNRP